MMAFAATVPPSVVAPNRIQFAMMVATNFFGQNTPAIAATEAAYAEMWAQDAAAMYGCAASSSAATALTPFIQPPQTTNTGGQSAQAATIARAAGTSTGQDQAALSQLMSALSQQLQALASGVSTNASAAATPILTAFSDFDALVVSPLQPFWSTTYSVFSAGRFGTGLNLASMQAAKPAKAATTGADALGSAGVRGPVLASIGKVTPVGKLSVPQSWASANPIAGPGNGPLLSSGTDPRAAPRVNANPPMKTLGGIPTAGTDGRSVSSVVLRNGRRSFKMPRPVFGG